MKRILPIRVLCLVMLCFLSNVATAQMGWNSYWTWLHGDNTTYQSGNYGVMGVPATTNKPPSRFGANTWKDQSGNFWMYGGVTYDVGGNMHAYGDLWRYSPASNQWTWISGSNLLDAAPVFGVQGVPSAANYPGSRRRGGCWTDASGNFWFFGGAVSGMGSMSDLWKYEPATNMWTWVKGPNIAYAPAVFGTQGVANGANRPRARFNPASWQDNSGNFWLFGGDLVTVTPLNDLWKYDPSANQWTWMGGDMATDQPGVYGVQGVPSVSNKPGARFEAGAWTDESGNFWLFGGNGYGSTNVQGDLNDLWRYEPSINRWTWMKGASTINASGSGLVNVPDINNTPGVKIAPACQADTFGNLWMIGGSVAVTEVWEYDIATNMWHFRKNGPLVPIYGSIGIPDPANRPGGRTNAASWMDEKGRMYMFGGLGKATSPDIGSLNDTWRLECSAPDNIEFPTWPLTVCPNDSFTIQVTQDPQVVSYTWTLPSGWGGSSDSNSITILTDNNPGAISVFSTSACPMNSDPFAWGFDLYPQIQDTIDATICQGQSYSFNGTPMTVAGIYADTFSSINGCDSVIALDLVVNPVDTPSLSMSITQGENPGCIDSLVEFTAVGTNAGSNVLYTWLVNGVPVATGDIYSTNTLLTGDLVQALLTMPDSACLSTGTLVSQSISMIRAYKPASPLISFIGTMLVSSIVNVQWYGPGGLIPGAVGQSYEPQQDGPYYAKQINPGCYSNPSNILTIALLDIASYDLSQLSLYPNPAGNTLTLDWGTQEANVKLELFHPSGRKVLQDIVVNSSRKNIDLTMLPAGVYFLVLKDASGRTGTVKIMHR